MKILICTATSMESDYLRSVMKATPGEYCSWQGKQIYMVHVGIGMINTALSLGALLAKEKFDHAIMTGICGTFRKDWDLGMVVEVRTEIFADLGADSPGGFVGLERMGFPAFETEEKAYFNRMDNPRSRVEGLTGCVSASVNKVNGEEGRIADFVATWPEVEVENMEGAAFFQACLQASLPFTEIRGISNYVENRNVAAWEIKAAKQNAQEKVLSLIE